MTYNFCTYFDKNYLLKGLALHASLVEYCPNFHLWILCFDDITYQTLGKLDLKNVELIRLSDFEDEKLLAVKPNRKISEYCWTCTPSLPLYILKQNPELQTISYLDADLLFFDSPQKIYEEFGNNSIMIIPHNFPENEKWREKTSGIYNVGMLVFRNDPNSLECLNWWRKRCLEWCFDYYEDGKLGDQLYLNDWPERFRGVYILKNEGADVASWNIKKYNSKKWPLIFYHFHGFKFYLDNNKKIKPYPATVFHNQIYKKYLSELQTCYQKVLKIDASWNYGASKKLDILRLVKQKVSRLITCC